VHFQDKGAYGRIVHLQPVSWKNNFPVIGGNPDGDGTGEPVPRYKKPNVGKTYQIETPQDSDEFNGNLLGSQWQWHANPEPAWGFPFPEKGVFRMFSVEEPAGYKNLWNAPNLLLQKFSAEEFTATAKVSLKLRSEGEKFGLVVMGLDYSFIGVTMREGKLYYSQTSATNADKGSPEIESAPQTLSSGDLYLRVTVKAGAICTFSFSSDGKNFVSAGRVFKAREGRWIGAKVGFFLNRNGKFNDAGSADIDWIRFEK
jgi:beta-xylosidase